MVKFNRTMGRTYFVLVSLTLSLALPTWASVPLGAFANTSDTSSGLLDGVCLEPDCPSDNDSAWIDDGNACVFDPLGSNTSFTSLQTLPTGSSVFLTNEDGKVITIDGKPLSANEVGKDPRYTIHETADGMVQITDNEKGICYNPNAVELKDPSDVPIITRTYEDYIAGGTEDQTPTPPPSLPVDLTSGAPETSETGDYNQCKRAGVNGDLAPNGSQGCLDGYNAGVLTAGREDFIPSACKEGFIGPPNLGDAEKCQSMIAQESPSITRRDEATEGDKPDTTPRSDESQNQSNSDGDGEEENSSTPEAAVSDEGGKDQPSSDEDGKDQPSSDEGGKDQLNSEESNPAEARGEPIESIASTQENQDQMGASSAPTEAEAPSVAVPEDNGLERDDDREPEPQIASNRFYDPMADDDEREFDEQSPEDLDPESQQDGDDFFKDYDQMAKDAQKAEAEGIQSPSEGIQQPNSDTIEAPTPQQPQAPFTVSSLNGDLADAEEKVGSLKDDKGVIKAKVNSKGQVVMGIIIEKDKDSSDKEAFEPKTKEQLMDKFSLSEDEFEEQKSACLPQISAKKVDSLEQCFKEDPKNFGNLVIQTDSF